MPDRHTPTFIIPAYIADTLEPCVSPGTLPSVPGGAPCCCCCHPCMDVRSIHALRPFTGGVMESLQTAFRPAVGDVGTSVRRRGRLMVGLSRQAGRVAFVGRSPVLVGRPGKRLAMPAGGKRGGGPEPRFVASKRPPASSPSARPRPRGNFFFIPSCHTNGSGSCAPAGQFWGHYGRFGMEAKSKGCKIQEG